MLFLITVINNLFFVYTMMLMIRVLASWVPEWSQSRFILFIAHYTDPYLMLFRRIIPPLGMLDLSPLIAFLALGLLRSIVVSLLLNLL